MTLSPQQDEAFRAFKAWLRDPARKPFFYLAGYAGSGKTYLAKTFAAEVEKAVFAAFTGKAALVMAGKGCEPCSTIHSLIYKAEENDYGIVRFRLNKNDSAILDADLVVIDEVSMVGEDLGRDLLSFGKPILVLGDPAQLPPVGDGAGFFTKGDPDFMLTEIHRQAQDNPIIRMSMRVREGERLSYGQYGASLVVPRDRVTQKMILGADQVLCGINKSRRTYNHKIRAALGRGDGARFVEGERVVALRNDKDRGLLNGSIWRVEAVEFSDADETEMTVKPLDAGMVVRPVDVRTHHAWLDGRERELPHNVAREFQPFDYGYVLSVHKAQGSQWDSVVLFDESFAFKEDRARHLYTGITRAAERITIVV
jgi:exodeoxyribonuclease V